MELTLIVQELDSFFAGNPYRIFRDLLQISCRQLKDLLQRCCDNVLQNVHRLKERLDRDQKTKTEIDDKVNARK